MQIDAHTDGETFCSLHEEWNKLLVDSECSEIFLTHEWQTNWWNHFGQGHELRLIRVTDSAGAVRGIAPLYLAQDGGRISVRFVGGVEVSDYLDIIAPCANCEPTWSAALEFLSQNSSEWNEIDLHCLKADSPTLEIVPRLAAEYGWASRIELEEVCPRVHLHDSWESYLSTLSKKDRHELRRKTRKLETEAPGASLVDAGRNTDITIDLAAFVELHRLSTGEKACFMTPEMEKFFLDVAQALHRKGWLRLWFLDIGGRKVAALLAFDYKNSIYLYNSGYDPAFGRLSVGVVALGYVIRQCIEEGKEVFDFLRGSESYKYDLGGRDTQIYNLKVTR